MLGNVSTLTKSNVHHHTKHFTLRIIESLLGLKIYFAQEDLDYLYSHTGLCEEEVQVCSAQSSKVPLFKSGSGDAAQTFSLKGKYNLIPVRYRV